MGDQALEHIRKHPDIWVLSFRFVYGLRTVMPVAIGLSGVSTGALPAAQRHRRGDLGGRTGRCRRITSARCSKACSAASRSTSYGCSAPCWYWALVLWLRRRFKNARLAQQIYADAQGLDTAEQATIENA